MVASVVIATGSFAPGGDTTRTLTEIWDGTRWEIEPSPNGDASSQNFLNSVRCVSASDCTAVGDYYDDRAFTGGTLIEHWDGTSWSLESSATSSTFGANLSDVSCIARASCLAVGQDGNGGHAHNDQLSIELNVDGEDWIADPGTYLYHGAAPWRG